MTTEYKSEMDDSIVQTDAIPLPSRENKTTDAIPLHSGENELINAIPLPSGENKPTIRTLPLEDQSSNEDLRKTPLNYALQEQDLDASVAVKLNDMGSEGNDNEMPPIAAVPPDFLFNKLLMDIENSISRDELKKLKSMLKGNDLLGKRVLQEIDSASDLFVLMRERRFICCEDIVWLQAILQVLHRPDLIERTLEYSRLLGSVIYFFEASEQPENGCRYAQFHVKGRDFTKCTRRYIEGLRMTVARLVSVPPQFVNIAVVEPSSSFMVTLMLPELYVRIIERLLKTARNNFEELTEFDVDTIAIGETIYDISDMVIKTTVYTDQHMEFVNVYQQLKMKSKQLEDREIECIQLRKQLKYVNGTQSSLTNNNCYLKFDQLSHLSTCSSKLH